MPDPGERSGEDAAHGTQARWVLDPAGLDRHRYQSGIHDCDLEGCTTLEDDDDGQAMPAPLLALLLVCFAVLLITPWLVMR